MPDVSLTRKIKTLKSKLQIDDSVYEEILLTGWNVTSTTDLNNQQAMELFKQLEAEGVKAGVWVKYTKANKWKYNDHGWTEGFATPAQKRLLNVLWKQNPNVRSKTDFAFETFVCNFSKIKKFKDLRESDVSKVKKAIENL